MNIIKISVKFNKNIKPGRNVFHFCRLSYKVNHGLVKRLGFCQHKVAKPLFDGSLIIGFVHQDDSAGYGWH
jgi:hypothetical protein